MSFSWKSIRKAFCTRLGSSLAQPRSGWLLRPRRNSGGSLEIVLGPFLKIYLNSLHDVASLLDVGRRPNVVIPFLLLA